MEESSNWNEPRRKYAVSETEITSKVVFEVFTAENEALVLGWYAFLLLNLS
jgi:hypothetical protein